MAMHDEATTRGRRQFLKAAGGAAVALVAAKGAHGQTASAKGTNAARGGAGAGVDRGLWVTWYDLPENGRKNISAGCTTYLPNLLKRPGFLWAAHYATRTSGGSAQIHHVDDPKVPTGFHYVLLVGVTDGLVFGNPVPSAIRASLPEQGDSSPCAPASA